MADQQPVIDPIDPLVDPPLRTEAPADFTPKADRFLAALPAMVRQINAAIGKMNALATWVAGVASAALTSANNSDASAKAAGKSVTDASAQFDLAKGQADAASNTYASMQVLAAALQSAAGVPSMDGKQGYFMQVGFDGRVRWQKTQSIGDVITAMSAPDASWVPDNARYSQSLYPELFAKVGYAALDDTGNQSKYNQTIPINGNNNSGQTAIGENGVVIHCSYSGYIFRSTDYGVNWNNTTNAFSLGAKNGTCIAYDPIAKVFVAASQQGGAWRSTDQGLTWTFVGLPGNWASWNMFYITNAGRNTFVVTSTSDPNNIAVTTDGGLTWVLKPTPGSVKWASWDGTYLYCNQVNVIYRSANLGSTWTTINIPAPYIGGGQVGGPMTIGRVATNGKALIFGMTYSYQIGNNVYQYWGFYVSYDALGSMTWIPVSPINTFNNSATNMNPSDMSLDQFGIALMAESGRANTVWRVSNIGIPGKTPVVEMYNTSNSVYQGNAVTTDNLGFWILGFGNQIKRITPAYDPKALFALPRIIVCEPPFNNYVKAKLQ